jgi:hypothetical protein
MKTKTALCAIALFASSISFAEAKSLGVSMQETLKGTWISTDESNLGTVKSEMTLSHPNLTQLITSPALDINGQISVGGLTDSPVPVTGKLNFSFLPTEIMTYKLNFCLQQDADCYSIEGKKHVLNPTAISGPVRDVEGNVVGTAYLQFDIIKDFVSLVRSIKITRETTNE